MMTSKTSIPAIKWEKYLSLTATSLSTLSLVPGEAGAAVVKVLDRPIAMPTSPSTAYWDVDGNGAADVGLINGGSGGTVVSNGLRGRGMVAPTALFSEVSKLSTNFVVGPTLAGKFWGPQATRVLSFDGDMQNYYFNQFTAGDNYFGFRFDKNGNGNLHYGFAIANVNNPSGNPQFKITKWAYNDVAGAPVTVGPLNADPIPQVPGPIGLAGLAAGAAWSRRLRKRIRQAS